MAKQPSALRIWDLPTRLFHLAVALCLTGAVLSVKLGGAWMDWHVRLGIATLLLVVFRIIWGLVGPRYARFTQFVASPGQTWRYLQSTHKHAGHNPLGAWSVLAMLVVIGWQGVTGLFASDEMGTLGPFASKVSNALSERLTGLHQFNEIFLYAIVGLHLAAILFYTIKGQGLVGPMIHGDVATERVPSNALPARDDWRVRGGALLLALALTGLGLWLCRLAFNTG